MTDAEMGTLGGFAFIGAALLCLWFAARLVQLGTAPAEEFKLTPEQADERNADADGKLWWMLLFGGIAIAVILLGGLPQ